MLERRSFPSGLAALAAVALSSAVTDMLAMDLPSTSAMQRLPIVFDPVAFCTDLINAGYEINVGRGALPDDPGRPWLMITPQPAEESRAVGGEVLARWADRLAATPDHVERVVAFGLGQPLGAAA